MRMLLGNGGKQLREEGRRCDCEGGWRVSNERLCNAPNTGVWSPEGAWLCVLNVRYTHTSVQILRYWSYNPRAALHLFSSYTNGAQRVQAPTAPQLPHSTCTGNLLGKVPYDPKRPSAHLHKERLLCTYCGKWRFFTIVSASHSPKGRHSMLSNQNAFAPCFHCVEIAAV